MNLSLRRRKARTPIKDWAGVVSFMPSRCFTPGDLNALKAILTNVLHGDPATSVRILGSLHSCSGIFQSDVVIDTGQVRPLDFVLVKRARGGAEVEASAFMSVHDFLDKAAAANLSLTSLGGTDAQTLAGLISTNTAGATGRCSIYDSVEWVEYLTVSRSGRTIVTKKAQKGSRAFRAAICSLGAIGCLTRVGFRLVNQRFYQATLEIKKLDDVLLDPAKTSKQYEFWRIEWLPKNDVGWFWGANQVPQANSKGDYDPEPAEYALLGAARIDHDDYKAGPFCRVVLDTAYARLIAQYKPVTFNGPMRNMIPLDRDTPLRVAMAEWSFRPADLQRVRKACHAYFEDTGWPNLPIEIECARTDAAFMSPWRWPRSRSPYIMKFNFQYLTNFLDDGDMGTMRAHLEGLWKCLQGMNIPFRAHWAKINFLTPEIVAKNQNLRAFKRYAKPMFLNPSLRTLLGYP